MRLLIEAMGHKKLAHAALTNGFKKARGRYSWKDFDIGKVHVTSMDDESIDGWVEVLTSAGDSDDVYDTLRRLPEELPDHDGWEVAVYPRKVKRVDIDRERRGEYSAPVDFSLYKPS